MDNSDLIVLGAGPAGCATAIVAAQAGLRVTIVERDKFPRHRPGETLHPGLESLFRRLGAWQRVESASYIRHPGISIKRRDESQFQPYGADTAGAWLGFQVPRSELDALLLQTAIEHGVVVQQSCAARAVILHQARVIGVETQCGPVTARFTIDAGGGSHWLARQIALPVQRFSPLLLARYGYVTGSCPSLADAPALRFDSGGWTWMARIGPDSYHWTRLTFENRWPRSDLLPEEFRTLTPTGRTRTADVTWRMATATAGPGYFLVGDAAAVLDPASSHGVLRAIMSGMQAGYLAAQVVRSEHSEASVATFYCDWLSRWFDHDVRELRTLYDGALMEDIQYKQTSSIGAVP